MHTLIDAKERQLQRLKKACDNIDVKGDVGTFNEGDKDFNQLLTTKKRTRLSPHIDISDYSTPSPRGNRIIRRVQTNVNGSGPRRTATPSPMIKTRRTKGQPHPFLQDPLVKRLYSVQLWDGDGFDKALDQAMNGRMALKSFIHTIEDWGKVWDSKADATDKYIRNTPQIYDPAAKTPESKAWRLLQANTNQSSKSYIELSNAMRSVVSSLRVPKSDLKHSQQMLLEQRRLLGEKLQVAIAELTKAKEKQQTALRTRDASQQHYLRRLNEFLSPTSQGQGRSEVKHAFDSYKAADLAYSRANMAWVNANDFLANGEIVFHICNAQSLTLFQEKENRRYHCVRKALETIVNAFEALVKRSTSATKGMHRALANFSASEELSHFLHTVQPKRKSGGVDFRTIDESRVQKVFDRAALSLTSIKSVETFLNDYMTVQELEVKMTKKLLVSTPEPDKFNRTLWRAMETLFALLLKHVPDLETRTAKARRTVLDPICGFRLKYKRELTDCERKYANAMTRLDEQQFALKKANEARRKAEDALSSVSNKLKNRQQKDQRAEKSNKKKKSLLSALKTSAEQYAMQQQTAEKQLEDARIAVERAQKAVASAEENRKATILSIYVQLQQLEAGRVDMMKVTLSEFANACGESNGVMKSRVERLKETTKGIDLDHDCTSFLRDSRTNETPPDYVCEYLKTIVPGGEGFPSRRLSVSASGITRGPGHSPQPSRTEVDGGGKMLSFWDIMGVQDPEERLRRSKDSMDSSSAEEKNGGPARSSTAPPSSLQATSRRPGSFDSGRVPTVSEEGKMAGHPAVLSDDDFDGEDSTSAQHPLHSRHLQTEIVISPTSASTSPKAHDFAGGTPTASASAHYRELSASNASTSSLSQLGGGGERSVSRASVSSAASSTGSSVGTGILSASQPGMPPPPVSPMTPSSSAASLSSLSANLAASAAHRVASLPQSARSPSGSFPQNANAAMNSSMKASPASAPGIHSSSSVFKNSPSSSPSMGAVHTPRQQGLRTAVPGRSASPVLNSNSQHHHRAATSHMLHRPLSAVQYSKNSPSPHQISLTSPHAPDFQLGDNNGGDSSREFKHPGKFASVGARRGRRRPPAPPRSSTPRGSISATSTTSSTGSASSAAPPRCASKSVPTTPRSAARAAGMSTLPVGGGGVGAGGGHRRSTPSSRSPSPNSRQPIPNFGAAPDSGQS